MKRLVLACMVLSSLVWTGCSQTGGKTSGAGRCANCACSKPVLRHVVLFKFKEGTSVDEVKQIEDAFAALPGEIKEIACFEWGIDVSPEKKSQGYTHCFLLTFRTAADRDAYLVAPAHKEFGSIVGPHLDKVCVVDYWTKR